MRLYEIAKELRALEVFLDGADSEDPRYEEAIKALDSAEMAWDDKLQNIISIIKDMNMYAAGLKDEETRLHDRRKVYEGSVERLKAYLTFHVEPGVKWCRGAHQIGWRKSETVEITGEIPDKYARIVREPDKVLIKSSLKSGATLPFATLVEKNNIQIK